MLLLQLNKNKIDGIKQMNTEQINILCNSEVNQDLLMIQCVSSVHLNQINITEKLTKERTQNLRMNIRSYLTGLQI